MKRFLLATLFILSNAWAQIPAPEVVVPELSALEGAAFLEHQMKSSRALLEEGSIAFIKEQKSNAYPRGDFALLWGLGSVESDQQMTRDEYVIMWRIMNYLSDMGFRVVMNTKTLEKHVREAVETEGVAVVLYSGHGNQTGFYDFNKKRISYDIFANKARSVYQFILAACYGSEARPLYNAPSDLMMFTWSGLTNSTDLERFIMGNWSGLEGHDLIVR